MVYGKAEARNHDISVENTRSIDGIGAEVKGKPVGVWLQRLDAQVEGLS